MVLKKKKDVKVKKMYLQYQNLCTSFVINNNVADEYDDVALVRFLKVFKEGTHLILYG